MKDLVFLEPNKIDAVPFTTSKVIAEITGVTHKKIKMAINKQKDALETFGLSVPYKTESNGGRPETIYKLNEQQATLLITFLKNTPVVVLFKIELVKQFFAMRTELQKRKILRQQLKPIRRELTDVLQEKINDKWAYKNFTDLAYKTVTGKNSAQLRKERGADKKAVAIDYMTAQEIEEITKLQNQMAVLVDMGMDYHQVKTMFINKSLLGRIAI